MVAPAQVRLIAEIQSSGLLHADETSWPQQDEALWLWVFVTTTTTLYTIAGGGKATVSRLLDIFTGRLMSDGWFAYRGYPRRLRCWAHVLRKAQGLVECYDPGGRASGYLIRTTPGNPRGGDLRRPRRPPGTLVDLPRVLAQELDALRRRMAAHRAHRHAQTQALAGELFNDWDAIFRVLAHPELPLTNSTAERALCHWVIVRRISHGTRTAVGSCAFTLLASVIDTGRQRGHSPWTYLAAAIADRRVGRPLAPLPQPGGAERLQRKHSRCRNRNRRSDAMWGARESGAPR